MRTPDELINAIQAAKSRYQYVINAVGTKKADHTELLKENDTTNQNLEKLNNILLACKLMLEKITYQNKAKIEQFVTYALQNIFTDRDYSIELDIKEDVKNPALTLMLVENGIKQDIKDSVGGGIITTLGFLLQIYYLEVYNKNRVMFIDEGLKEVSKIDEERSNVDYLGNLLNFLKWLSTEKDYKFVIITHDESVKSVADTVYNVKLGEVVRVK